jgi:protein-S-isoprenylcysteine O-methyltransferase Ste14
VLYIGFVLTRQHDTGYFTRRYGAEKGFRRFRSVASALMSNDGLAFVVLCLVSRDTLGVLASPDWRIAAGTLLVLLGVSTKVWAAATLGAKAYYWHNFFAPHERVVPTTTGPYRFLKNPMYTVGYLHTYGFALATGSLFGLIAALFDQAAILVFYWRVEKPHFETRLRAPSDGRPSALDRDARRGQSEGSSIWSHDPGNPQ